MKLELKSIGIWSFFKISFIFNLIFGFIFGFIYAMFAGLILTFMSSMPMFDSGGMNPDDLSVGALMIVMPIFMAIFMAVINTIMGVIALGIYNLVAKLVGGLELKFDQVQDQNLNFQQVQQPYAPPQTAATQSLSQNNYQQQATSPPVPPLTPKPEDIPKQYRPESDNSNFNQSENKPDENKNENDKPNS
ncbi:MAG: hypothetical protein DRP35_04090 [Candidatus Zixiibacteriota bacterium]|nr:MAG: hypothetical protein DRP35_04090 [candidate division Zixibacteria bacterium]